MDCVQRPPDPTLLLGRAGFYSAAAVQASGPGDRSPFVGSTGRARRAVSQPSAAGLPSCVPLCALGHRCPQAGQGGSGRTGSSRVLPTAPAMGQGRKVAVCNGISSLAAAGLAGKTLLRSMGSGG